MSTVAARFPVIIKVAGIGNGGIRTVGRLPVNDFEGVELIAIGHDSDELTACGIATKIMIERKPSETGSADTAGRLDRALTGADMIFLVVTEDDDTRIAPMIRKLAQGMGVLVTGIATCPSMFSSGTNPSPERDAKLRALREGVDTLLIVQDEAPLAEILTALGA